MINIIEGEVEHWKLRIEQLKEIRIRIREEGDVLVCSKNPCLEEYTPTLRYKDIFVDANKKGDA